MYNIFKFKVNTYLKIHVEKKLFQSNEYGRMDVNQNKFGCPIIITALFHGKPVGVTDNTYKIYYNGQYTAYF
jgi:hypothetical protein